MNNTQPQSLRIKVSRIITGFAFIVVLFYTFMMLQLKDSGLRDATHSVLFHEAQLYLEQRKLNHDAPLPNSYSLKGYIGEENLPKEISQVFPAGARERWHRRRSGIVIAKHHRFRCRRQPVQARALGSEAKRGQGRQNEKNEQIP